MLTAVGIIFIGLSIYNSIASFAIIGTSLFFWCSILLYIRPSRQIPITYLTASTTASMSNIERVLTQFQVTEKGIYLPPKNLGDIESSLIFIPKTPKQSLPHSNEIQTLLFRGDNAEGLFFTPPGFALIKFFEQSIETSFLRTDLYYLQLKIPEILVEKLEIAENVEVKQHKNNIVIEVIGNIFQEVCQETQKFPKAHNAIGCILSSSFACILAKSTGKPIKIINEEHKKDKKKTKIEYQIMEEKVFN